MNKSVRIFRIGFVVALVIIGMGTAYLFKTKHDVSAMVKQCESSNTIAVDEKLKPQWEGTPLVCDPDQLEEQHSYTAVQANMVYVKNEGEQFFIKTLIAGILLILVSATPWIWNTVQIRKQNKLKATIDS